MIDTSPFIINLLQKKEIFQMLLTPWYNDEIVTHYPYSFPVNLKFAGTMLKFLT